MNQKGEEWLIRGVEDRSSIFRDFKVRVERNYFREGRDFLGIVRGREGNLGGKMDVLRGVSIERRFSFFRDGRWEEISMG